MTIALTLLLILVVLAGCTPGPPPCPAGTTPHYRTVLRPVIIGKQVHAMPFRQLDGCLTPEKP